MVERSNSEMLRGVCNRQTDKRTFAILESLSRLKTKLKKGNTGDKTKYLRSIDDKLAGEQRP